MTAQIVFFPFKHSPDQETLRQLAICQEQLYYAHIELRFQYRNMAFWQYQAAKMRYHHGFRHRWKVITSDGIENLHDPLDFDPQPA